MMLDNLQYDNILLNYSGSVGNGLVLYVLYIAYCFMMPIIFLNLLVSEKRIYVLKHSSVIALSIILRKPNHWYISNNMTMIKIAMFKEKVTSALAGVFMWALYPCRMAGIWTCWFFMREENQYNRRHRLEVKREPTTSSPAYKTRPE